MFGLLTTRKINTMFLRDKFSNLMRLIEDIAKLFVKLVKLHFVLDFVYNYQDCFQGLVIILAYIQITIP